MEHHAGSITFLVACLCVSVSQMAQAGCPTISSIKGCVNVDDFDVLYWYTDTPLFLLATCMLLKAYQITTDW